MPVKYLSQEWIDEYNAALAADDAVRAALKGKSAALQMVISDSPQGEIRYWLRIADGSASAGLGDLDDAEVTISQSYETSAQVNSGELDGQKAFTQGKVKIRRQDAEDDAAARSAGPGPDRTGRHRHRILNFRARPSPPGAPGSHPVGVPRPREQRVDDLGRPVTPGRWPRTGRGRTAAAGPRGTGRAR